MQTTGPDRVAQCNQSSAVRLQLFSQSSLAYRTVQFGERQRSRYGGSFVGAGNDGLAAIGPRQDQQRDC
ncbi:hypothetical protein D3C72_2312170 [compost metagenome]